MNKKKTWCRWLIFLMFGLMGSAAHAQLLVNRTSTEPIAAQYEVTELAVQARVRDQAAEVRVSQTFYNPGRQTIEAEALFPIPLGAAIDEFTLLVNGKELPGRLLPRDEARQIYEDIVRRLKDPALLEYMGQGLFRTQIFPIPPGEKRTITLHYTELCKREGDTVFFTYPFATQKFSARPIPQLTLDVQLETTEPIKVVYSPSDEVVVDRVNDRRATVRLDKRHVLPQHDFQLAHTLADGAFGATLLSYRPDARQDGYFLLLASPAVAATHTIRQAKNVVFVLDRSGSMSGQKIEQAQAALRFVLNNLERGDLFNIIAYDGVVDAFKPELQRYTPELRAEALHYVDNIRAGGSTNINEALLTAMGQLQDTSRPNYVLFLTDGLPTAGEKNENAIAQNVTAANHSSARLFAFGVGYDVNTRLLDRLSTGNHGVSEYVKPDEDLEARIAQFYSKMSHPVLTDIELTLAGTDVNRTYPRQVPDLFAGGQLVWVGRYSDAGRATIELSGQVNGERQHWRFPARLASSSRNPQFAFVEKIWATRRIGNLIDQIDLYGKSEELIEELVALSTQYGILTPYTSFLADETTDLNDVVRNEAEATQELQKLEEVSGISAHTQRAQKQALKNATNAPPPPQAVMADAEADGRGAYASSTIRQVGTKTFYRRKSAWIEAGLTDAEIAQATVLKQLSGDYFALASRQSAEMNQYLSFKETVVVRLDNRVYRIEQVEQ